MAKEFSDAFYHSKDWEIARDDALKRDAYLCQHCLARGVIKPAVMVHHIIELTPSNINDPNVSVCLGNLVSLCDRCHKKAHGWIRRGATREGLAFDEHGNLVPLDADANRTQT